MLLSHAFVAQAFTNLAPTSLICVQYVRALGMRVIVGCKVKPCRVTALQSFAHSLFQTFSVDDTRGEV